MFDYPVRCPDCGHTDDIQYFDVGGADPGNVFCVKCHCEFYPDEFCPDENSPEEKESP